MMDTINTISNILLFNVLFDVDGKRFLLYSSAAKYYDENNSKYINALNLFVGWHTVFERS
jgi:hypothetical protein